MAEFDEKGKPNTFTLTILILGLFAGGMGMFLYGSQTFIGIDQIMLSVLIVSVIALAVHLLFLMKKLNRYFIEIIIYCIAGWGSLITGLLLLVNFFFHSPEHTQTFTPSNENGFIMTKYPVEITVDDPELRYYSHMLSFKENEIVGLGPFKQASFTTAKGCLGFKILLKKELR